MDNRPNLIFVVLMLLLAFLLWSNAFIAIGRLRLTFSAVELLVVRFAPVGIISTILIALNHRAEFMDLVRRHPVRLVGMSFFCVPGYNILLNLGQGYINASAASLLITMNPLITLLLAVIFLKESLTAKRAVGTLLAFAGLVVVVVFGRVGVTDSVIIPFDKIPYAVVTVLAPVSWAVYTIIAKPIAGQYTAAGLNFAILAVGSIPMYFGISPSLVKKTISLPPADMFALLFLIIGCTLIAFYLWLIGVKALKASNVSLFVFLNPPLTALFAYLLFGRLISGWFFVGGSVMLIGIALAVASDVRAVARQRSQNRAARA